MQKHEAKTGRGRVQAKVKGEVQTAAPHGPEWHSDSAEVELKNSLDRIERREKEEGKQEERERAGGWEEREQSGEG